MNKNKTRDICKQYYLNYNFCIEYILKKLQMDFYGQYIKCIGLKSFPFSKLIKVINFIGLKSFSFLKLINVINFKISVKSSLQQEAIFQPLCFQL